METVILKWIIGVSVSQKLGVPFWELSNEDCSILRSILGSPYPGKLHIPSTLAVAPQVGILSGARSFPPIVIPSSSSSPTSYCDYHYHGICAGLFFFLLVFLVVSFRCLNCNSELF